MFSFYEVDGQDGRLRIAVDDGFDEPPYMQSIGKYKMGTPLFECVVAAVQFSSPKRDQNGLYWTTRKDRRAALAAARRAA